MHHQNDTMSLCAIVLKNALLYCEVNMSLWPLHRVVHLAMTSGQQESLRRSFHTDTPHPSHEHSARQSETVSAMQQHCVPAALMMGGPVHTPFTRCVQHTSWGVAGFAAARERKAKKSKVAGCMVFEKSATVFEFTATPLWYLYSSRGEAVVDRFVVPCSSFQAGGRAPLVPRSHYSHAW